MNLTSGYNSGGDGDELLALMWGIIVFWCPAEVTDPISLTQDIQWYSSLLAVTKEIVPLPDPLSWNRSESRTAQENIAMARERDGWTIAA